jgi:inositol 1,4,5-triphosphate receptor type 1
MERTNYIFLQAFDNKHVTFEEHIRNEHNMWHYLYFIVLIKA